MENKPFKVKIIDYRTFSGERSTDTTAYRYLGQIVEVWDDVNSPNLYYFYDKIDKINGCFIKRNCIKVIDKIIENI